MDNLHGSPEVAWAWVAGLWLGDGHFGLYENSNGKNRKRYNYGVVFANTDRGTCETLYQVLRELGIGAFMDQRRYDARGRRTLYRVQLSSWGKVRSFCEGVMPYLVDRKRREAELLLEAAKMGKTKGSKWSQDEKLRMTELIAEMKSLKSGEPSETIMASTA